MEACREGRKVEAVDSDRVATRSDCQLRLFYETNNSPPLVVSSTPMIPEPTASKAF